MVEVTDNDVIDFFQKLNKIREFAEDLDNAMAECNNLLEKTVLQFNINIRVEIFIDVNYAVNVACDELRIEKFPETYIFVKDVFKPRIPGSILPSRYLSYISLRNAIALAVHEKLEGLVTRLVERVVKAGEELRNRTEILKKIVETVEHVAQQHQVV